MTVANNDTEANNNNVNNHALVVFSGIADLEAACAADDEMMFMVGGDETNVGSVFYFWFHAVSGQSSGMISTDDALFVVQGR